MAKRTYGVVYEKDGWRVSRHQSRAGEIFSIERTENTNSSWKVVGLQLNELLVEVHFEQSELKTP